MSFVEDPSKGAHEPKPSRRKFLASVAGVGATLVAGEAISKNSPPDINVLKTQEPKIDFSFRTGEKMWDQISKRLIDGLNAVAIDKELAKDPARYSMKINEVFDQFFIEASDLKSGSQGKYSSALDMYTLHFIITKAANTKLDPKVEHMLTQAWEQISTLAINESLQPGQPDRIISFVPDATA